MFLYKIIAHPTRITLTSALNRLQITDAEPFRVTEFFHKHEVQILSLSTKEDTSKPERGQTICRKASLARLVIDPEEKIKEGIPLSQELKMRTFQATNGTSTLIFGFAYPAGTPDGKDALLLPRVYQKIIFAKFPNTKSVTITTPNETPGTVNPASFKLKYPNGVLVIDKNMLDLPYMCTNAGTTTTSIQFVPKNLNQIPEVIVSSLNR